MLKILVNIFYRPTEELERIILSDRELYVPINGSSGLSKDEFMLLNPLCDNVGDNISELNPLMNEMTSIYWAWKHYSEIGNPEYIGHNHYRRLFNREDLSDYSCYDLIVANPIFSSDTMSLTQQYAYYHVIDDLQKCVGVVRDRDIEFGADFVGYLNNTGTNYAPCNMFVMKKGLFFEWCEFIFPILFDLKKEICDTEDFKKRDNYQKRALCFLTERIFNYWCFRKKEAGLKIKEVEMIEYLEFKPASVNERGDFTCA